MRQRYGLTVQAPSADDGEAFAGLVADRYFALTVAAIKAADPNHLVLGCDDCGALRPISRFIV